MTLKPATSWRPTRHRYASFSSKLTSITEANKLLQGNFLCTRGTDTSTHVTGTRLALTKETSLHFIFLAPVTGSPFTYFASKVGSTLPNLATFITHFSQTPSTMRSTWLHQQRILARVSEVTPFLSEPSLRPSPFYKQTYHLDSSCSHQFSQ